jgi:exodeoxyribonuclease VII small subunit
MSEKKEITASFEESLEELETIVSELESGAKPLDESLLLYEKGIAALRKCHAVLDVAEKRIRVLVKGAAGEPELRESDGGDLSGAASVVGGNTADSSQDSNDSETSTSDSGQKTAQQSVDSGASKRQNRTPSSMEKPASAAKPGNKGGPKAGGGSLFGSAQQ